MDPDRPSPTRNSTPAGKACVERARKECEDGGPRSAELQWLDAQLLKAKKDVAFTNEIRARIAKLTDAAADGLDVECVAEFCRIAPMSPAHDGGSVSPHGLGDGFDGHLRDGQTWYAIRRGYRLVR